MGGTRTIGRSDAQSLQDHSYSFCSAWEKAVKKGDCNDPQTLWTKENLENWRDDATIKLGPRRIQSRHFIKKFLYKRRRILPVPDQVCLRTDWIHLYSLASDNAFLVNNKGCERDCLEKRGAGCERTNAKTLCNNQQVLQELKLQLRQTGVLSNYYAAWAILNPIVDDCSAELHKLEVKNLKKQQEITKKKGQERTKQFL